MKRDAQIDRSRNQVEIAFSGPVGSDEFSWGMREIERACREDGADNVVWDFREADLSQLNFVVIQGTVEDWPTVALADNARIAVVAGTQLDEILLRLWKEAGMQRDKRERRVFLNIDEARDWAAGK